METIKLVSSIISNLKVFFKSKVGEKVKSDFQNAINTEGLILWKKIKPLFIEEYEIQVAKNFEEKPDDDQSAEIVKKILENKLDEVENQNIKNELIQIINKIDSENINEHQTKTNTINSVEDSVLAQDVQNLGSGNINIGTQNSTNFNWAIIALIVLIIVILGILIVYPNR